MSDKTSAKAQAWLDRYSRYQSVGMMLDLDEVAIIARAHVAQAARIAELEAQIAYMAAAWGDDALQVEELTRQLAEARDQALEDAALWADILGVYPELNVYNGGPEWYKHGKRIASVIRAMKGTKP